MRGNATIQLDFDTLEGELEYKRFGWTALPSVLTCGFLNAWCAVELGEFALAKRTTDRALRIVNKVAEPYSIVYAHLANGLYQLGRGHPHDAVTAFDAAKAISERSQMQLPIAGAWLAAAYVHAARPHDALSLLAEADRNATYRHGGMYNWFHHHLSMAQAHLAVSDVAAAQAAISRAQEIAVAAEEVVHLAWACKIQGDIAATTLNEGGEAARRAYVQALGIAEPRGLRPLEAHCHAALAQLHERLGLPNEAAQHRQNAEQITAQSASCQNLRPSVRSGRPTPSGESHWSVSDNQRVGQLQRFLLVSGRTRGAPKIRQHQEAPYNQIQDLLGERAAGAMVHALAEMQVPVRRSSGIKLKRFWERLVIEHRCLGQQANNRARFDQIVSDVLVLFAISEDHRCNGVEPKTFANNSTQVLVVFVRRPCGGKLRGREGFRVIKQVVHDVGNCFGQSVSAANQPLCQGEHYLFIELVRRQPVHPRTIDDHAPQYRIWIRPSVRLIDQIRQMPKQFFGRSLRYLISSCARTIFTKTCRKANRVHPCSEANGMSRGWSLGSAASQSGGNRRRI